MRSLPIRSLPIWTLPYAGQHCKSRHGGFISRHVIFPWLCWRTTDWPPPPLHIIIIQQWQSAMGRWTGREDNKKSFDALWMKFRGDKLICDSNSKCMYNSPDPSSPLPPSATDAISYQHWMECPDRYVVCREMIEYGGGVGGEVGRGGNFLNWFQLDLIG